ncbi:hypothetical protein MIMGU_mgv11b013662mg [Erythranthe guttata]|uniref:Uncharacterized protein n=1 Tax=Erythranthe guttata TaxID=4155 RepID=A0A022RLN3_ERYGU|nr:hypothetical protein MIMGU_mgv11b013662mg [Erythranthe guttata]
MVKESGFVFDSYDKRPFKFRLGTNSSIFYLMFIKGSQKIQNDLYSYINLSSSLSHTVLGIIEWERIFRLTRGLCTILSWLVSVNNLFWFNFLSWKKWGLKLYGPAQNIEAEPLFVFLFLVFLALI